MKCFPIDMSFPCKRAWIQAIRIATAVSIFCLCLAAFGSDEPDSATGFDLPAVSDPYAPPPEVVEKTYLYEIVRYLYRWYLDEIDVRNAYDVKIFPFQVSRLSPRLDDGDRSEFAEIVMPVLDVAVRVKKDHYRVEEENRTIQSRGFKITNVVRGAVSKERGAHDVVIDAEMRDMRDFLFKTRSQVEFPDETLLKQFRLALRRALGVTNGRLAEDPQLVYLSPLSPVANEWWVFWENKKTLIQYSSAIDLNNPEVWSNDDLTVRLYNIRTQTVISMDEAPGSNKYLTRDQVGRTLFNCVILGKRLEIPGANSTPTKP